MKSERPFVGVIPILAFNSLYASAVASNTFLVAATWAVPLMVLAEALASP